MNLSLFAVTPPLTSRDYGLMAEQVDALAKVVTLAELSWTATSGEASTVQVQVLLSPQII